MRTVRPAALLVFALAATSAYPCVQNLGDLVKPVKVDPNKLSAAELRHYLTTHPPINWKARKEALSQSNTAADRNDYAVALMHLGRAREAVAVLEKLEQTNPGRYATAANLGTAYELAGDNVKAYQWIREGIRRDPNAHEGSEWLHALILEMKIAGSISATDSVLGLHMGEDAVPSKPFQYPRGNTGKPLDAAAVKRSIAFQLHERLQFVQAPEPIVGDILFDYANLLLLEKQYASAADLYELAIRYAAPRADLARQRLAYARKKL